MGSIISPDPFDEQQIGIGQSWRIVGRQLGTWYQNAEKKPIMVQWRMGSGGSMKFSVGVSTTDFIEQDWSDGSSALWVSGTCIVPPGHFYRIEGSGGISSVKEMTI